jgi:hydroxymethylbilane synthase
MEKKVKIKIGTRKSKLALTQANFVANKLKEIDKSLDIAIVKITTLGDKIKNAPFTQINGKGIFIKEIEEALLKHDIDIAVHSAKDVPTIIPEKLCLISILKRESPFDALISRDNIKFYDLKRQAIIGTSSSRRASQLKYLRSDIKIVNIRGNLDTRINKLTNEELDAIVVAEAGLNRLGNSIPRQIFNINEMIPQVGQGALALETRKEELEINKLAVTLNDSNSFLVVETERDVLYRLGGGCHVPIACFSEIIGSTIKIYAMVGRVNGEIIIKEELVGKKNESKKLSEKIANNLLEKGAKKILAEFL